MKPAGAEVPWRFVRSLHMKKKRDELGLSIGEGPRVVRVCIESGLVIHSIFFSRSFAETSQGEALFEEIDRYRSRMGERGGSLRVYVMSDDLFSRVSTTETPQGILAVIPIPPQFMGAEPAGAWVEPLVVIGSGIQDPGNVGTMVRACAAFGATRVVFGDDSADPFSPKALRSSSGAFAQVKVIRTGSTAAEILEWKHLGVPVWKTDPATGESLWDVDLSGPAVLIFGSESRGIPPQVEELTDLTLRIPMPGGVESLNVGVSCAVVLYEVTRQRRRAAMAGTP